MNSSSENIDKIINNSNLDEMLEIVKKNGLNLKYASEELKNNKQVVLAAINQSPWAFKYASEALQQDYNIAFLTVSLDSVLLKDMSKELKNNRDIVLAAINSVDNVKSAYSVRFASDELKNDKEIILSAISKNVYVLQFASINLRDDTDIILAAIEQDPYYALKLASNNIRKNKDIVLAALKKDKDSFEYASEEFTNNEKFLKLYLNSFSKELTGSTIFNNKKFYQQCELKLKMIKEQSYLENKIPINNNSTKVKKF